MRDQFSETLVNLTSTDPRVYLLTGDHGYALFDALRKTNPDRYINAGIAEQNMVGVAAGMAKAGLIPIVYGLAAFIPVRVLEQIKLDICFEKLKVILIGDGAGVVYSKLGVSHQSFEDIAAVRALPNIRIFSPCDKQEMKACLEEAIQYDGPSYIRVGKCDVGNIHDEGKITHPGLHVIKKALNSAPVIVATGSMVKSSLDVINNAFPDFGLVSASKIKPMNEEDLLAVVGESPIISIEEHSVYGGLGGTISEIVSQCSPRKVLRLGIRDVFSDKCGSYEYVMKEHRLDVASIQESIRMADL